MLTVCGRVSCGRLTARKRSHASSVYTQSCAVGGQGDNFNLITKEDLLQVCGFGEKKARMIIATLEAHGAFESFDAVKRSCYGIGDKHIALLKAFGWERCEPLCAVTVD